MKHAVIKIKLIIFFYFSFKEFNSMTYHHIFSGSLNGSFYLNGWQQIRRRKA